MRSPLRLSGIEEPPLRPSPFLGEHSRKVLADVCGYDEDRIEHLLAAAVVGAHEQIGVMSEGVGAADVDRGGGR